MTHLNRRMFLHTAAGAAALATLPTFAHTEEKEKPVGFTLPKLPYAYDALEPHIDAKTMEIHHDRHHAAYVKNLNDALKDNPEWLKKPVDEVLKDIKKLPDTLQQTVINNGGGHANHTLFWTVMGPSAGGAPSGPLAKAIDGVFGSFDKFQKTLAEAGTKQFGSGWAWLVADGKGTLSVIKTANQDSPILQGLTPLLGLDVWEHAYYLKYQNKRADYITAWWNVVNWKTVADAHAKAVKGA
jgi:Fe-Mn family superoxide dismutase